MAKAIIIPKMGNTVETVVIAEIFVKEGDKITVGQKLYEYETDKTAVDFNSEVEGTILKVIITEGAELDVLSNAFIVGEPGEDISEFE